MANSWDTYSILFLSAILSLGIPSSLFLFSSLFFSKKKSSLSKTSPFQLHSKVNQTILGQRINVRFFLAVNASLILMTLAIELIPCVITLRAESQERLLKSSLSIVTLAGFAVLGLLYSVKKGDMGWLSSYQPETQRKKKRSS